jgi:prepilin-type N-terminal cleavage/methylation domain-containing protein
MSGLNVHQAGDTIVEVLIAIAVLSLILTAAFITANNSLKATRDAEEHGQAQALVTAQLEKVKQLASANPTSIFVAFPFCVDSSLQVIDLSSPGNAAACTLKSDGTTPAPSGFEPAYHLSVSQNANIFTATATWASATGSGKANVSMAYRVYQD